MLSLSFYLFAPDFKVGVDASPFREVTWQHSPLATALQPIEYSTKYIIEIQRSRFRLLPGFLKKRSYFLKLFPSDITRVLFAHTRCVALLVCLVLYHFVRVLVKKILNRFLGVVSKLSAIPRRGSNTDCRLLTLRRFS